MKKGFLLFILLLIGGVCFAFSKPSSSATTGASTDPEVEMKSTSGCYLGVFREGAPQNMGFIKSFEKVINKKPAMVMWYLDYSSDFPKEDCEKVYAYNAVPHIIWEPWYWGEDDKIKLDNIINGEWDKYIEKWAKDCKDYGKTVFLRWGHEFNIEKYPWGVGNNGKDPKKYIKAYRHVHDIFTKAGAKNVKWIWCFNNYSNPDEEWNDYELAYPGDDYVDWIGIDGYNWGITQSWSGWQSFKELFRDQVRDTSKKHPKKPVMIAEFGSAEDGGNKAQWVKEIPSALKISMKQVKCLLLFDVKKECDWRAVSCKETEDAYRSILKDPFFLSSPEGIADVAAETEVSNAGKKTVLAKKASNPVIIDGTFAPFEGCAPIVMEDISYFKEGVAWKGVKDLSAKLYFLWDDEYLYMYAKVTDNMPMTNSKTNGDIWNGDCIEMTVPNYQIGFSSGDGRGNKPIIWIWQKRKQSTNGAIYTAKVNDPTGYILEAKVSWKELGFITPKTGAALPFDVAVDDADATWQRTGQLVWNGDYLFYKDPDVWGELKFTE